jgi:hypothetical protein
MVNMDPEGIGKMVLPNGNRGFVANPFGLAAAG